MADWANPKTTSNYVTFVDEVKNRDIDAITLQLNAVVAAPPGAIKFVRTPGKFQEWSGAIFVDRPIGVEGGGTGGTTPPTARTGLGLGTMAVQNANAIAVTGGTIANLTSSGGFGHTGSQFNINAPVAAGNHTLVTVGPATTEYSIFCIGSQTPGLSTGLVIQAGFVRADSAFIVRDRNITKIAMNITGDMVVIMGNRLVIPVGVDAWATP